MRQLDEEGRYRLGAADLLTSKRCVLEGAVPPIAITQEEPVRSYGWVSKGLPTPATGGLYVVEFFGKSDIAILAYIDPFGRVFSTSEASAVPPARTPDLTFARVPQQAAGEELGCVYVHESDGSKKDVAQYRCASGRYALFDSWYDFGPYDMNLTYEDAMARAYLAFVLRPSLGAPSVPERGIGGVFERLKGDKPLTAMRSIVEDARCAEDDPVCKPPALVSCLAHWLTEAGLDKLAGVKDEALRLVRTVRYANTYYLGVEDGEAPITIETVWAIEAALNRFLLVSEAFGDRASMATEADCARWDAYLLETVAAQRPVMDGPADAPAAERAGEWSVRCAIGAMLERLRLPVRLDASMRFDVEAGAAAFDLKVPGASLMPSWAWREESGWVQASERDRDAQAHRYALHLGLVLAAAAFDASSGIRRVDIVARPCENAAPSSSDESKGRVSARVVCAGVRADDVRSGNVRGVRTLRGCARRRPVAAVCGERGDLRCGGGRSVRVRRRPSVARAASADAGSGRRGVGGRHARPAGRRAMQGHAHHLSCCASPHGRRPCRRDRARFEHGGRHPARSRGAGGGGSPGRRPYGSVVHAAHGGACRRRDRLGRSERSGGALPRRGSVPCGARTCSVVVYERRPGDGGAGAHRCRRGSGGP